MEGGCSVVEKHSPAIGLLVNVASTMSIPGSPNIPSLCRRTDLTTLLTNSTSPFIPSFEEQTSCSDSESEFNTFNRENGT